MIKIRQSTFETNSSSSHSLVITKQKVSHYTPAEAYEELHWIDSDGMWSPYGDMYFGRYPFQVLSSFEDKLRYAYACAPIRRGRVKKSGYEGYWHEYYKITNVVKKFFGTEYSFKGLDLKRCDSIGTDDSKLSYWLQHANISLIEFLTNKNIIVICDGDEYCIWTDMKKLGLINKDNIELAIPEREWWETDESDTESDAEEDDV